MPATYFTGWRDFAEPTLTGHSKWGLYLREMMGLQSGFSIPAVMSMVGLSMSLLSSLSRSLRQGFGILVFGDDCGRLPVDRIGNSRS
jgi:hypothetical protein